MNPRILIRVALSALVLSACAGTKVADRDYTIFNKAAPRSILIVPVLNHSNETQAADLFLTTLAAPLAERGYYVFPTNMTKKLIEGDGMSDAGLVHSSSTQQMASLFGADSILYVEILDWSAKYKVVASTIEVKFIYTMKDGHTGQLLWQDQQAYVHTTSSNSGNIFADLIANAVVAMVNNGRADYTPVAIQANIAALLPLRQGIPYGPYSPARSANAKNFPSTGSGNITNAAIAAVSYPIAVNFK